jgi:hypothetical protein
MARRSWRRTVARKPRKNKQKHKPHVAKLRKMPTPRQSRFAKALMDTKIRTRTEAAVIAGYSPKNARQSANQAFNQILSKGPEAMQEAGLSLPVMIDKYLRPLLEATDTKLVQYEGQFTDFVEVADNAIRLGALEKAFRLLGAYPPEDPVLGRQECRRRDHRGHATAALRRGADRHQADRQGIAEAAGCSDAGTCAKERSASEGLRYIPCTVGNPERCKS